MKFNVFLAACALAMSAAPLAAQENAQVDVIASMEPAKSSLSVAPGNSLRFGRVTIPDKSTGGPVLCNYNLGFGSTRVIGRSVDEIASSGNTSPTPSGCQFLDFNQSAALLLIGCNPGLEVNYLISFTSGPDNPSIRARDQSHWISSCSLI
jgi:hypothetical protein